MTLSAIRSFPSHPSSVPLVRSFVCDEAAHLPWPLNSDVELVASELATNAIQHAGTDFDVRVELTPGIVFLEVTDAGTDTPRQNTELRDDASRGRGLHIVERLATDWGIRRADPGPGKTVWVRLGQG